MPTISPSTEVLGQQTQQALSRDAFADVGMEEFLKMMIAELQHQDPLNPMDNGQILEQIGYIRDIVASDRLTETLESVFMGQNLATASSMIGRLIVAVTDDTGEVTGRVDRVSIEDGKPKLTVGEHTIDLKNILEILDESADSESSQLTTLETGE